MSRAKPVDTDAVALKALTFLASDEDRFQRFLALSGLRLESLREAAGAPGFLAGVLSYLVQDESLLVDFARFAGLDPEEAAAAARASADAIFESP